MPGGTALVTGAAGFIGRHALGALRARGYAVHALARPGRVPAASDGAVWWEADLGDADAVDSVLREARPDAVLHLAWGAGPGRLLDEELNRRSADDTIRLAGRLARTGCRHLVLAGSCLEAQPATAAGRTPYARAKRAVHEQLSGARNGLPVTCAHIFSTFGPGEPPERLVPRVVRALLNGEPLAVSAGEHTRDFLAVDDLADALACVLGGDPCGQIDVCSGQGRPLHELFDALAAASGSDEGVLVRGAADLADWQLYDAVGEPGPLRSTGWRPSRTFEEAVEATVAWWGPRVAA